MTETPDSPRGYLGALRDVTATLVSLSPAIVDAIVTDCPGWVGRDVVAHLGRVYASVTAIVDARATGPVDVGDLAVAPADGTIHDWIARRSAEMLAALEGLAPDERVWTWSTDHTGGFYHRRMVHETTVHVADLQRAIGRTPTIDRAMACDGIDEAYELILPFGLKRRNRTFPTSTLHLHCTDGPGEWLVVPRGDTVDLTHEHAKGDVAWRGPAASLFLAVWGRRVLDVTAFGDPGASREWSELGV